MSSWFLKAIYICDFVFRYFHCNASGNHKVGRGAHTQHYRGKYGKRPTQAAIEALAAKRAAQVDPSNGISMFLLFCFPSSCTKNIKLSR
jgi:hypothetical protein